LNAFISALGPFHVANTPVNICDFVIVQPLRPKPG
jgi:hypothetical protein